MIHPTDEARWRELESNAHLPEVQELIRQEILNGTIRVRPKPGRWNSHRAGWYA